MPELLLVGDQDIPLISVPILPVLLDLIDEEADGVTSPSPYLGWISELVHEPGLLLPEGGGHGLALLSCVDDDDAADSSAVAAEPGLLLPEGGGHGLALLSRVGGNAVVVVDVDDNDDDD